MNKWNLIIDVAQCENCNNCVLAAKDELVGNEFPGYSAPHPPQGTGVIRIERVTRGSTPMVDAAYLPRMCNHCDAAPCQKVGNDGAVTKRPDGIVLFDPVKAKGHRDLVDACPYGAIVWNEALQLPQTWFFDAHLLDGGWKEPRCVSVCPTSAIQAMKISDEEMASKVNELGLRSLKPELKTRPRVYYKNMDRFDQLFLGGSAVCIIAGAVNCCADAEVILQHDGREIGRTKTDDFGDFKFDGLAPDSGAYVILISHPSAGSTSLKVSLSQASVYLGNIELATSFASSSL
jgi:Fe-S-cluster-containing dehydrogenase component